MFDAYDNNFEFTADGIFRQRTPPACPKCGVQTNRNGWNPHTALSKNLMIFNFYITYD